MFVVELLGSPSQNWRSKKKMREETESKDARVRAACKEDGEGFGKKETKIRNRVKGSTGEVSNMVDHPPPKRQGVDGGGGWGTRRRQRGMRLRVTLDGGDGGDDCGMGDGMRSITTTGRPNKAHARTHARL